MILVGFILLVIGFALTSIGSLAEIGKAILTSVAWGLLLAIQTAVIITMLFFVGHTPMLILLYITTAVTLVLFLVFHWRDIWKEFTIQVSGIPLMFAGALIMNVFR